MNRALLTALALSLAFPALAVPTHMAHQGRIFDPDGTPLTGSHTMRFQLFDGPDTSTLVWSEEREVEFTQGFYAVQLGDLADSNPLDDTLFAGGTMYLSLALDGVTLEPRQVIGTVPYAARATRADEVDGGPVDADTVAVAGIPVIDQHGNWVGAPIDYSQLANVPEDEDSLADLQISCVSGESPIWDGTAWTCSIPALAGHAFTADSASTASIATTATTAGTAAVATTVATSTGAPVIDADGAWVGPALSWTQLIDRPDDSDVLRDLGISCLNGEAAVWETDAWVCGEPATAAYATTAGSATTADSATTAGSATTADSATVALSVSADADLNPKTLSVGDTLVIDADGNWVGTGVPRAFADLSDADTIALAFVPAGAVLPFNLSACPQGWSEYGPAYGRTIRGIDRSGSAIDPDGERAPGATQEDSFEAHDHSVVQMIGNNNIDGVDSTTTHSGEHHNETRRSGMTGDAETRGKNVALLFCEKDGP